MPDADVLEAVAFTSPAVVLASFFGRTAREIAEAEGVPLGTANADPGGDDEASQRARGGG